jgi:hypothetical protein
VNTNLIGVDMKNFFDGLMKMANFEGFGTSPHKLVRRDDPVTSFESAVKVDTTKLEQLVYVAIGSFGSNGCISDQVLEMFPTMPYSSVTARYKALFDKGLIEIIGTRQGKSGRNQRVMKVKNVG